MDHLRKTKRIELFGADIAIVKTEHDSLFASVAKEGDVIGEAPDGSPVHLASFHVFGGNPLTVCLKAIYYALKPVGRK